MSDQPEGYVRQFGIRQWDNMYNNGYDLWLLCDLVVLLAIIDELNTETEIQKCF